MLILGLSAVLIVLVLDSVNEVYLNLRIALVVLDRNRLDSSRSYYYNLSVTNPDKNGVSKLNFKKYI